MIYVFKDGSGYQSFPEPKADAKPYLEIFGEAEQRIRAREHYQVNAAQTGVEFPAPPTAAEIAAQELADEQVAMNPSRLQCRLAMIELGVLDEVEAAVALADQVTQEAWASAQYFRRLSPLVLGMIAALGWTDAFTDDLCRLALTKEA